MVNTGIYNNIIIPNYLPYQWYVIFSCYYHRSNAISTNNIIVPSSFKADNSAWCIYYSTQHILFKYNFFKMPSYKGKFVRFYGLTLSLSTNIQYAKPHLPIAGM